MGDFLSKNIKVTFKKIVNEEKAKALIDTEKIQKTEDKFNKEYQKEVKKKMDDYLKTDDGEEFTPPKRELTKKEEEYVDEVERGGGMEDLQYDLEPSDKFKKRAEEDMGKEVSDKAKKRKEKKDKSIFNDIISMGDDIEYVKNKPKDSKHIATEGIKKIKRMNFKTEFSENIEVTLNLIPENYKYDNHLFEMTDGNRILRVRWDGDKSSGEPIIVLSKDKKLIGEDKNYIKDLYGYKSEDYFNQKTNTLQENKIFNELIKKSRTLKG